MPGEGHTLVEIEHPDQLCRVLKLYGSYLIICVEFRKLDGLDLEFLVLAETKIFLEVGLVMSGSRTQLRGVKNLV